MTDSLSIPLVVDNEDNKDAARLALNLPPSFPFSGTPSLPSSTSTDSHQVAESLVVPSPVTPQRASSSRPILSIRTPDASPKQQRFRSLAENSSPSRTPDYTLAGGRRSPTTIERLNEILGRRRRSPLQEHTHARPSPSGSRPPPNSKNAPKSTGGGYKDTVTANGALSLATTGSQSPSQVAPTASPRGPAVSRKVAAQTVSTPLTNVLRHRRDRSNESQANGAIAVRSQTASSVTESETQNTSTLQSQTANGGQQAHVPPNTPTAGLNLTLSAEEQPRSTPSQKQRLPYKSAPIMRAGDRSFAHAHPTPPTLDTRPSMRLRTFRSGHVTLEPVEPQKANSTSTPPPSPLPVDVPLVNERPLFLDDPDDFLDSSLGSNFDILSQQNHSSVDLESWPLQTQAPYDFDSQPVQSQWKAFADSQI